MQVVAVCNQKGGVGKTTTTAQVARAARLLGARVLVVDLDPQGNISSAIADQEIPEDQAGIADVLSARAGEQLAQVIVPTVWDGVELAPTAAESEALGVVRDELVLAGAGRENRLSEALATVRERYDLVLIDCPPSLDQLTINGLTAAHAVLIVTHAKLFSANGLARLLGTIETVRNYYNPGLQVGGVLMNQVEETTVAARTWSEAIQDAATARSVPLLTPPIPKRQSINDATEAGQGMDQWRSPDAAALADIYRQHVHTLMEGMRS